VRAIPGFTLHTPLEGEGLGALSLFSIDALVLVDFAYGDESQALIQTAPRHRRVQQHISRGQVIEQGLHHAISDALSLQLGRDDHQADGAVVRPKLPGQCGAQYFPVAFGDHALP